MSQHSSAALPEVPARVLADESAAIPRSAALLLWREAVALFRDPPPPPPDAAWPQGDGHVVLVLPPFLCTDRVTRHLRNWLDALGYASRGWELGRCLTPSEAVVSACAERIEALARRERGRLSLLGISLGGVIAREAAKRRPLDVRQVITLCSPFRPAIARRAEPIFRLAARGRSEAFGAYLTALGTPPPAPTSAFFTRSDGIVPWQSCLNGESALAENIEIEGAAHATISRHPEVLATLAERLAQQDGAWRPRATAKPPRPGGPKP